MCPSDQYLILARGAITHIASLKSHQHSVREHAWGLEQLLLVFYWGGGTSTPLQSEDTSNLVPIICALGVKGHSQQTG